jgi:hypothetical protein
MVVTLVIRNMTTKGNRARIAGPTESNIGVSVKSQAKRPTRRLGATRRSASDLRSWLS